MDSDMDEKSSEIYDQAERLWELCSRKGDISLDRQIEEVQDLLQAYPQVINMSNDDNQTPLHLAAIHNQAEILSVLLHKGADPELHDTVQDYTPLMHAITKQSSYCFEILLDYKVNINTFGKYGRSALHVAVEQHNTDGCMIKRLLELNANVDKRDEKYQQTPIHIAAKIGSANVLQMLLDRKPNTVDKGNISKLTPLHLAAGNGHRDCCKILKEFGVDCSVRNSQGETPLMMAVKSCYLQTCKVLLNDNQETVNMGNKLGQSPLVIAVNCKKADSRELLQLLLEGHPHLQEAASNGDTPLHYAAKGGFADKCALLIKAGADCNIKNDKNRTPLHCAAKNKFSDCIAALLNIPLYDDLDSVASVCGSESSYEIPNVRDVNIENPADIDSKDDLGKAPIHYALEKGSQDCCLVLLRGRANVCLEDKDRYTPLHFAALQGLHECCSRILSKGASVHSKNKENHTPLHLAAKVGSRACCQVLMKKGAKLNVLDKNKKTPLHYAAEVGSVECCEFLLKKIDKTFDPYLTHATPLHLAAKQGHLECCKKLSNDKYMKKVLVRKDENGQMPHNIAFEVIRDDVFCCLLQRAVTYLNDSTSKIRGYSKGRNKNDDDITFKPSLSSLLQQCIHEKRSMVVETIVKCARWRDALSSEEDRSFVTNFSLLVEHYPDSAKTILDKCVEKQNGGGKVYTFLFLEDTYFCGDANENYDNVFQERILSAIDKVSNLAMDVTDSLCTRVPCGEHLQPVADSVILHLKNATRDFLVKVVYPSDFTDDTIVEEPPLVKSPNESISIWSPFGPNGKLKSGAIEKRDSEVTWRKNHPLRCMVENERLDLLGHEVCQRLLNYKWERYIEKLFCSLFFVSAVFAGILSIYVTLAYDWVYVHQVHNITRESVCEDLGSFFSHSDRPDDVSIGDSSKLDERDECSAVPLFFQETTSQDVFRVLALAWLLLVVAVELFKIHNYYGTCNRMQHLARVFMNYIWAFVLLVDWTDCASVTGIREEKQWICGVISVMVAWFELILLLGSMPRFGLYLVIFNDFMKKTIKLAAFAFLQVFAFSVAFQMVLRGRFVFSNFPRTMMKILTMTMGDLSYDDHFSNEESPLHYPLLSHLLLICFLGLISVIMLNFVSNFSQTELDKAKTQTKLITLSRSVDITLKMESMFPALRRRYTRSWVRDLPDYHQNQNLDALRLAIVDSDFSDDDDTKETSKHHCKCEDMMTMLEDIKLQISDLDSMVNILKPSLKSKKYSKVSPLSTN